MMDWSVMADSLPSLLQGLLNTLWICLVAALCTLVAGMLLTFGAMKGNTWVRTCIEIYTQITLGLPVLVLLYLLFFVLPEYGLLLSPLAVGISGLTLYYAPYVAQVIRGALESVPPGQYEAGRALGMSPIKILVRLISPQALPLLLPSLTGLMIGLLKDSALLSIISVQEFMHAAKQAVSTTYASLEIYLLVAVGYWLVTAVLEAVSRQIESRLTRHLG